MVHDDISDAGSAGTRLPGGSSLQLGPLVLPLLSDAPLRDAQLRDAQLRDAPVSPYYVCRRYLLSDDHTTDDHTTDSPLDTFLLVAARGLSASPRLPSFVYRRGAEASAGAQLRQLLDRVTARTPDRVLTQQTNTRFQYQFWGVREAAQQQTLQSLLTQLGPLYPVDSWAMFDAQGSTGSAVALFADDQLQTLGCHRLLADLNGMVADDFVQRLQKCFNIRAITGSAAAMLARALPERNFILYVAGQWYQLQLIDGTWFAADPVRDLDASIVHDNMIAPMLGIHSQNDERIGFRTSPPCSVSELQRQVDTGQWQALWLMPAPSIARLMALSDQGRRLPVHSVSFPSVFDAAVFSSVQRIALINPTKFLGNMLLAGGLIQRLCTWCREQDKQLLLVLDESFEALFKDAFPGAQLVFYPRKALLPGSPRLAGIRAWLACVRAIRAFRADLAFTIEEDSVCHRLTHFSGAAYKVSSTVHRYHWGFDQVLDIPRSGRPADEASIWFSVRDVFRALGFPTADSIAGTAASFTGQEQPSYMRLTPAAPNATLQQQLSTLGLSLDRQQHPVLLLHAGASKPYKQWPVQRFAELASLALQAGWQPVLIGAGAADQAINQQVQAALLAASAPHGTAQQCVDLCNQLSLPALASLMSVSTAMVGNDSGPSHLGSALGLPGVVIFGPTDLGIWRPLAEHTRVLERKSLCRSECSRHHCAAGYQCLSDIQASQVFEQLAFIQKEDLNQRKQS